MKSLFWKEWRESRVNLLVSVSIVAVLLLVIQFFDGVPGAIFVPYATLILAGLFGAWSFSNEKGTLEFLLSVPVARKTIFWDKWLIGVLNIVVIFIATFAMELLIYYSDIFINHLWGGSSHSLSPGYRTLLLFLSGAFIIYNAAFLMSIIVADTLIAFLVGILSIFSLSTIVYGILILFHLKSMPHWFSVVYELTLFLGLLFIAYRIFSRKEVKA